MIGVAATSSFVRLDTRMTHGQSARGASTGSWATVGESTPFNSSALLAYMLQSADPRRASLPQTEIVTADALKPTMVTRTRSPGMSVVRSNDTVGPSMEDCASATGPPMKIKAAKTRNAMREGVRLAEITSTALVARCRLDARLRHTSPRRNRHHDACGAPAWQAQQTEWRVTP